MLAAVHVEPPAKTTARDRPPVSPPEGGQEHSRPDQAQRNAVDGGCTDRHHGWHAGHSGRRPHRLQRRRDLSADRNRRRRDGALAGRHPAARFALNAERQDDAQLPRPARRFFGQCRHAAPAISRSCCSIRPIRTRWRASTRSCLRDAHRDRTGHQLDPGPSRTASTPPARAAPATRSRRTRPGLLQEAPAEILRDKWR